MLCVQCPSAGSRQEEQQHEPGSLGRHQDRIPEHEHYVHDIHETPRSVHGKVCQAGDCTCTQQSHCFCSLATHQGMMPLPPLAPLIPLVDFNLRVSGVGTSTQPSDSGISTQLVEFPMLVCVRLCKVVQGSRCIYLRASTSRSSCTIPRMLFTVSRWCLRAHASITLHCHMPSVVTTSHSSQRQNKVGGRATNEIS